MCSILGWNGNVRSSGSQRLHHATACYSMLHVSFICCTRVVSQSSSLEGSRSSLDTSFFCCSSRMKQFMGDHALAVVQHSQAEFQSPDDLSEFRRPLRLRINQKTPRFQVSDPCPSSWIAIMPIFFCGFFVDRLKTRNSSYLIIIHQLFLLW